jgi:hypothetical protein
MENAFYPLSLLGNKSKCDARAARARVAATYEVTHAGTRVKLYVYYDKHAFPFVAVAHDNMQSFHCQFKTGIIARHD